MALTKVSGSALLSVFLWLGESLFSVVSPRCGSFARFFLYTIIPSVLLLRIFLSSPHNNGGYHTSCVLSATATLLPWIPCPSEGKYKLRIQLRHPHKFLVALTLRRLCFRVLPSPWWSPFLLGIWFNKIPEKTVVWSANRDAPAPAGSSVNLTLAGSLVLTFPNGTVSQISNGASAANSASLQNNGNLVLRNFVSSVVWQSFDNPTDTLLLGQKVPWDHRLYSNANGTVDYSTGKFMLEVGTDGNVVLATFRWADSGYWWTDTIQPNVSLVFNESTALMYVTNLTSIIYRLTTNVPTPIDRYYHRATVEDTGNFQQYIYPKVNGSGWTNVWKAVTQPCSVNGICGVYGYCTSADNQNVTCSCLPGYSLMDPNVPSKGCYPNVPPQQCSKSPSDVTNYTIEVIGDADIVNNEFAEMTRLYNYDLEKCRQSCMDDCYCMAATLTADNVCRKKRIPFMNARQSSPSTNGIQTIIKVPVVEQGKTDGLIAGKKEPRSQMILKVCL